MHRRRRSRKGATRRGLKLESQRKRIARKHRRNSGKRGRTAMMMRECEDI